MNFPQKTLIQHLTSNDDYFFEMNRELFLLENPSRIEMLNNQITQLHVHFIDKVDDDNDQFNLLESILSLSKCLIELTFHQSAGYEDRNLTVSQFSSTISSSLKKLDIKLNTFEECLFIFDGRFPSLSHCSVYINKIFSTLVSLDNRVSDHLFSNM